MLAWALQSGFNQDLLLLTASYALIALGMYVPFVLVGRLSLAYGAYAAIGAYSVAIVATRTGWPLVTAWVIGAVVSCAVGVLLGAATARLSTWYLASATIMFTTAFQASPAAPAASAACGRSRSSAGPSPATSRCSRRPRSSS